MLKKGCPNTATINPNPKAIGGETKRWYKVKASQKKSVVE
jgi:hypothetical protein